MSEDLSWIRWWAFPWKNAHIDWLTQTGFVDTTALSYSHHSRVSSLFGIEPELPPLTSPALLQLVLSSAQQRDLVLTLVSEVYNARHDSRLNQDQRLWCQRLAKALPPSSIPVGIEDPLHALRAWVSPEIWRRLRLSFARPTVLEVEQHPELADTHGRLDTLWKATIWRATSTAVGDAPHAPNEKSDHVLRPQD
ncbi:type III secretion protein [Pseudomonas sp. YeP6b]|uniref:type III secretion protein n=1 Tax=Pseudomonas sp. YeP6b TaxID=2861775 RepID=UPI0021DB59A8|nr:type III secretion protein [Pseudomonas sp. YeP6b]UXZ23595.1 type III secretion protein [Pseudomonas sp. YeP6b]